MHDGYPKSWWRKLLGYKSIMVVDEIEFRPNDDWTHIRPTGLITRYHFEWQWRPFRKGESWISGPWTKFT